MKLNDNGLPEPGRELDAWICKYVLGLNIVHYAWPCGYQPNGCDLEAEVFCSEDYGPDSPYWYSELHPVYLPEHGTWPPEPYDGYRNSQLYYCHVEPCPFVSTTFAFLKVMEATREWRWRIAEWEHGLDVALFGGRLADPQRLINIELRFADYSDREHAYAHAVCCCAKLAMEGE